MRSFTTSKKIAVTLAYVGVVVQALSTMFLTGFYLRELGAETYGLYQMINAVAQYILVLDLGIGAVMIRYIAEFEAKDNREKSENFAFHFGLVILGVIALVVILGVITDVGIERIYPNLTADEYAVAHRMFVFIIVQLVFTFAGHYFQGLSFAYDQYAFERFLSLIQIALNTLLVFLLVKTGMGVIGIVIANSAVIVLRTFASFLYNTLVVGFRIRFHGWELSMLRPAFKLMLAMLVQGIVGYVNGTVDKTILGIMATKIDVAVYAVAMIVVNMCYTLPTAVSSVFQSSAVKLVATGGSGEELTDFVIRPGRVQFMIMGGFIAGFFLFGRDFLICWTEAEMLDAWQYALVIMIPYSISLVQNTCLAILNALDKRMFRSIVLVAMTVLNIGMTIALIYLIGPFGAPLATGISYVIGNIVIINIYYSKRIGLNVFRMFRGIFKRSWLCVFIASAINLPLMLWRVDGCWLVLLLKALLFVTVYGLLLLKWGINAEEKQMIKPILNKLGLYRLLYRS